MLYFLLILLIQQLTRFHDTQQLDPPTYNQLKPQILCLRTSASTNQISTDSLSFLLNNILTEKLIPHWLSTPWSFEGHTSVPQEGTIACGYFVSTTLQHAGFNLNRYTFAQQLPINEALTLSLGQPIVEINNPSVSERIMLLKEKLKEGLYFIGFDKSHVGYIQKKNGELFLIHSNYINARGVEIEPIAESEVFSWFDKIYIAEITTNRELMKKWARNERITVITNH